MSQNNSTMKENKDLNKPIDEENKIPGNDINQFENKSSVQNMKNKNKIPENDNNLQENTDNLEIKTEINSGNDNNLSNQEDINRELINNRIDSKILAEQNLLNCDNKTTSEVKEQTLKSDKEVETNTIKEQINNKKDILIKKEVPSPVKVKAKPVKEPPIEKKPFTEFVNDHLIPEIKEEFKAKGKEINEIYLKRTNRPIADDMCWVIYCEINDTCNFWLSFEKDDITSSKSFSLCKSYEKPSIIESFLIDEKKITLKLIISRILQRLNGQKLIGAN